MIAMQRRFVEAKIANTVGERGAVLCYCRVHLKQVNKSNNFEDFEALSDYISFFYEQI